MSRGREVPFAASAVQTSRRRGERAHAAVQTEGQIKGGKRRERRAFRSLAYAAVQRKRGRREGEVPSAASKHTAFAGKAETG